MGKTGDPAAGELLLKMLSSPEVAEAARGDLILALGELRHAQAVPALLAIARSRDEDKSRRMYAAGALGRIGDQAALPVLREMFAEKDSLLKASAASALARLSPSEAFPLLLAGMKDENWRVRVECAKALARPLQPAEAQQALPLLIYKAQSDPTLQVKLEAVRTLGAIGSEKAVQFLATLYRDSKNPLPLREESLASAARASLPAVLDAVRAVAAEEMKAPDQKVIEMTARVISGFPRSELRGLFAAFLDSTNPIVRIYGVRGAAGAGMSDLRARISDIAARDPRSRGQARGFQGARQAVTGGILPGAYPSCDTDLINLLISSSGDTHLRKLSVSSFPLAVVKGISFSRHPLTGPASAGKNSGRRGVNT